MARSDRNEAGLGNGPAATASPGALATAIAFGDALGRGDGDGARAQLEPAARLLTADGTEVSDPDSIGFVLAQLTSPEMRLEVTPGRAIVKGDVALCTQNWRLRATSDDHSFERASRALFVLRRSGVGWRIAVAAPWG